MKTAIVTPFNINDFTSLLRAYSIALLVQETGDEPEMLLSREAPIAAKRRAEDYELCPELAPDADFDPDSFVLPDVAPEIRTRLINRAFVKTFLPGGDSFVESRLFSSETAAGYDKILAAGPDLFNTDTDDWIGLEKNRFLAFAPASKRIFFAVGFEPSGTPLPAFLQKTADRELSLCSRLSCASEKDTELLRELTGFDPVVLCDPLLLLRPEALAALSDHRLFASVLPDGLSARLTNDGLGLREKALDYLKLF